MSTPFRLAKLSFLLLAVAVSFHAQTPTGTIAGFVADTTGAPVAGARIRLIGQSNGLTRTLTTSTEGDYSSASLPPGIYLITLEANGFRAIERSVTVETGATSTLNITLQLGELKESVTVDTDAPRIQQEQYQVSGLISRRQIEDVPLNGRNFLELAKLEPGVLPPTRVVSNRVFVPALGAPVGNNGRGTRVTVDGGSIMAVGNGGSAMAFSQEVVQEFQVTTVNFDLTTGLTSGAAVNVTTRSGGNDLHGSGLYFFRDHNLAAYPSLSRDPSNPDPFFQRRQYGFALGGPIRRERFFYFGNYERSEQRGVGATTILAPDFAHLSRVTPSPFFNTQLSVRLDGNLSESHTAFVRYSHDRVRGHGPPSNQPNGYPSSWRRQHSWADQSILGLTSLFGQNLVNDFRFSYFYVDSGVDGVTKEECSDCLGVGGPSITIAQTNGLTFGVSMAQPVLARRFHLNDVVTWQRGSHRLRFGVDWEYNRNISPAINNEPATMTLYSPQRARQAGLPVPIAFRTIDDVLQLPLQSVTVGIGDPDVPQADGGLVRTWPTFRLFFHDTWRFDSRLTVNYGLGWNVDHNFNYDLKKPALLAPILGVDGLHPTRKQWTNFSPTLGFAWTLDNSRKTVLRGGAGYFYDFLQGATSLEVERAVLGPPGLGRQNIAGSRLANCLSSVPGVPAGAALNFPANPTRFTGANLMTCLPVIQAELLRNLSNVDGSIQAIQLTKQGSLFPADLPSQTALHFSLGVQREIARDFVVSADFAYRRFDHLGLGQLDLNHFNSVRGPVIPVCTAAQRNDPQALCSTGPINVQVNAGRAAYKGLLLRADKRFSHGFQLLGSYAYSSNTGTFVSLGTVTPQPGFDLDDWLSSRGPLDRDLTHILNLAGVVQLPWDFRLGLNFAYTSAPPMNVYVGGIDFNGDGTTDDLLPGTTPYAFNRGFGRADLERLVAQFNQTYAGRLDAKGTSIPFLTLPERYWFGDNFHSLDLRLSRSFVFEKRFTLTLLGEVFNAYNAANLSGHSANIAAAAFGQPDTRYTQVFGSGGPRAFQFGLRFGF